MHKTIKSFFVVLLSLVATCVFWAVNKNVRILKKAYSASLFSITRQTLVGCVALLSTFFGMNSPAIAGVNFNPLCNPLFFVCWTLDTQGQWGDCVFECPINTTHFVGSQTDPINGTVSRYEFEGQSSYKALGTAACPPEIKKVKGVASWRQGKGLSGVASEEILWEQQFVTGGWGKLVSTESHCSSNPWLSENSNCTLISKDPVASTIPGPYPRSARAITHTMRQSLMQAEFTGAPPVVTLPTGNSEIKDGKVIFAATKFTPDSVANGTGKVEVIFETAVWPGSPDEQRITQEVTLNNNSVLKLIELSPAPWRVKARVKSPIGISPWSNWINFTVPAKKIKKIFKSKPPVKIQKQKKLQDLIAPSG